MQAWVRRCLPWEDLKGAKSNAISQLPDTTDNFFVILTLTLIDDWNIRDRVHDLVVVTTSSNTGINNEACNLIEEALSHELGNIVDSQQCLHFCLLRNQMTRSLPI